MMSIPSGGDQLDFGNKDQVRKVLFSATTSIEFETIIPLIEEMQDRGYEWVLIYDDAAVFSKMMSALPEERCFNIGSADFIRTLNRFKPNVYCTAHEGLLLTVFLTALMTRASIPIVYVPHGLIGTDDMSVKTRVRIWGRNSAFQVLRYLFISIRTRAVISLTKKVFQKMGHKRTTDWSYALVYSKGAKATLESRGVPPERVIVTGHPRFEWFGRTDLTSIRGSVRSRYGVLDGETVVIFLSQPMVEDSVIDSDEWGLLLAMLREISYEAGIRLLVKFHPRESQRKFEGEGLETMDPSTSLQEALASADVAVTISSTAYLESVGMGIPTISIYLEGVQGHDPSSILEGIPLAKGKDEVLSLVKGYARSSTARTLINDHNGSVNRIIDFIDQLVEGRSTRVQ